MAKKAKKATFPLLLHVGREADAEQPYLLCYEDGLAGLDDGAPVAVYKLVSTGRVSATPSFVEDE